MASHQGWSNWPPSPESTAFAVENNVVDVVVPAAPASSAPGEVDIAPKRLNTAAATPNATARS
jgi:hypothetical protein